MWVKAADLGATLQNADWVHVIKTYQHVIRFYLKKDILRSSAKPLMMKEILCHLANSDIQTAEQQFTRYQGEDPQFGLSREGELLHGLLDGRKNGDREQFDKALFAYTKVTPFGKVENVILAAVAD